MDETKTRISLDELSRLCQDDNWLDEFIKDTEKTYMLPAPAHLKQEDILAQVAKKQRTLICYSLKVSIAVAASILLLFTAPFSLEQTQPLLPPPVEAGQKLQSGLWNLSESIYDFSNELFTGR